MQGRKQSGLQTILILILVLASLLESSAISCNFIERGCYWHDELVTLE